MVGWHHRLNGHEFDQIRCAAVHRVANSPIQLSDWTTTKVTCFLDFWDLCAKYKTQHLGPYMALQERTVFFALPFRYKGKPTNPEAWVQGMAHVWHQQPLHVTFSVWYITQGKSFTMPANMTDESEKVNMGCRDALCKREGGQIRKRWMPGFQ